MRGRGVTILLVDGGDTFYGVPTKKAPTRSAESRAMVKARKILRAYNHLGYDALGLGPADFQFGVDKLRTFLKNAKFEVLCANLVDKATGEPVFKGSTIITRGGKKFGLVGLVLDSINDSYKKRITGEKYEIKSALETAKKIIPELDKKVDVIVVLSHLNIDDNEQLAKELPQIDAIVDPYSRAGNQPVWITEGEYVQWASKKPLLRIDGQGSRVGVCEISFPPTGRPEDDYYVYDYPLEPHIMDHPDMVKIVRGAGVPPQKKPGDTRLLLDNFLGQETCGACHEEQHAFWKKTKHAVAYATLEKTNEQFKTDCIECHTVGYGVAWTDPKKVGEFKDVQCESCHGINHQHADAPERFRMGQVKDSKCWGCHNPQILQKAFYINDVKSKVSCPKMK